MTDNQTTRELRTAYGTAILRQGTDGRYRLAYASGLLTGLWDRLLQRGDLPGRRDDNGVWSCERGDSVA